jgi:hypothetical protein
MTRTGDIIMGILIGFILTFIAIMTIRSHSNKSLLQNWDTEPFPYSYKPEKPK